MNEKEVLNAMNMIAEQQLNHEAMKDIFLGQIALMLAKIVDILDRKEIEEDA